MENFPFFSELEFNTACEEFASHSQKTDWNVVVVRASHKVRGPSPTVQPWRIELPWLSARTALTKGRDTCRAPWDWRPC